MENVTYRLVLTNTCGDIISNEATLSYTPSAITINNTFDTLKTCIGNDSIIYADYTGAIDTIYWQVDDGSGYVDIVNNTTYQGANTDTLRLTNIQTSLNKYSYRAVLSNDCGNSVFSDTTILSTLSAPLVTIPSSDNVCSHSSYSLSLINVDGVNISYQWQIDSSGTWIDLTNGADYSTVNTSSLNFAPNIVDTLLNSFKYRLQINSDCGTAVSNEFNIIVDFNYSNENPVICSGDSFALSNGSFVNTTGTYNDTLFNGASNGCDSLVIYNLNVLSNSNSTVIDSFCIGSNYTLPSGIIVTTSGVYNDTLFNASSNGCDSIINLTLNEIEEANIIDEPSDVSICEGENASFSITTDIPVATYTWYQGGTAIPSSNVNQIDFTNVALTQNGTQYFCQIIDSCGKIDSSIVVTLTVNENTQFTNQSTNQIVCEGNATMFFVEANNVNIYQWQIENVGGFVNLNNDLVYNNVQTDSLTINEVQNSFNGNTYRCIITGDCNNDTSVVFQLEVASIPSINLPISLCEGDSLTLSNGISHHTTGIYNDTLNNASSAGCDSIVVYNLTMNSAIESEDVIITCEEYTWIDGNVYSLSNNTATFTLSGAAVNGCDSVVTLNLTIVENIDLTLTANPDTIYSGNTTTLEAIGNGEVDWENLGTGATQVVSPTADNVYTATLKDNNGCTTTQSISIYVLQENVELKIPNAFTPDGDGLNDVFRLVNDSDFENIEISIYNRWGELVFKGNNQTGWDGTFNTEEQEVATYVYYIKANSKLGEKEFNISGTVNLIR